MDQFHHLPKSTEKMEGKGLGGRDRCQTDEVNIIQQITVSQYHV